LSLSVVGPFAVAERMATVELETAAELFYVFDLFAAVEWNIAIKPLAAVEQTAIVELLVRWVSGMGSCCMKLDATPVVFCPVI